MSFSTESLKRILSGNLQNALIDLSNVVSEAAHAPDEAIKLMGYHEVAKLESCPIVVDASVPLEEAPGPAKRYSIKLHLEVTPE